MPVNEQDRLLREKLKDFEAAYREADWLAFEQMLQKKKRRKAALIWLPAALLLITVGIFIFYKYGSEQDFNEARKQHTSAPVESRDEASMENHGISGDFSDNQTGKPESKEQPAEVSQGLSTGKPAGITNKWDTGKSTGMEAKPVRENTSGNPIAMDEKSRKQIKMDFEEDADEPRLENPSLAGNSYQVEPVQEDTFYTTNEWLTIDSTTANTIADSSLEEQPNPENASVSPPDDASRGFRFALRIESGMNLSFMKPITISGPGWQTHLIQEISYKEKAGLDIGLGFAHLNYSTTRFDKISLMPAPEKMNSHIKAMVLSTGLFWNCYNTGKWHLKVNAAINHYLKIKETVELQFRDADTSSTGSPATLNNSFSDLTLEAFSSQADGYILDNYAISGQKRYHAAMVTGISVYRHFGQRISTGSTFSHQLHLPEIPATGRRVQTLSVNVVFRYGFIR